MTPLRLHDICAGMPTIESYIEAGYLARRFHPELPYAILNYTDKTTYDRQWDSVTRQCRGLIYHTETEEIVARPFPKFFNYNEPGSPVVAEESKGDVYDKLDGCFPAHTTLNLWGGGTITIGEVVKKKLPVTVVGMNDNGELVPAVVTDWHHNGRKDHWLDIEVDAPVSRHSGAAGHPNRLRVTVNHHIFVNGEYKPAMEVRPGDTLVGQTWQPSEHERVVKRDVTVKSVEPVAPTRQNFPSGRTGFDITTTTGNYLARGVLVHNSLGILYPTPDGWAVATRGSFTSDQAQWATEWWQQRYANFQPYRDRTYLFEIIYPENRIVLDYGMAQDLFLLDVLEIRTGRRMSDPEWPGPRAELLMDAITLEDALLLGDRTNAEGFVWVEWATGTRVKVKQEDYIRKHRIVYGLNARSVWQVLADPDYTDEKWYSFLMELPEELQAWAENVAEGLSKNFGRLRNAAYDTYNDIVAQLGPEYTRRDFAELAKTQYQYPSMLFSLLDGKSIDEYCWKLVYPPGDIRPQGTVTNEEGE